jgi:hypothetical protein
VLSINLSYGQEYRIKAGVIALPISFAFLNAGAEYINKAGTGSWQVFYNYSTGAVAADVGETKRQWIIFDRIWYKGKNKKVKFMFGPFVEAGKRTKFPGYIHPPIDSIPRKWDYTEICPGAAIGLHLAFSKRIGLQAIGGPKMIVTTKGTKYLSNANTHTNYSIVDNKKITAGFRFTGCIYYQFSIKKSSR